MIPRTPAGDLIAALLLVAAIVALVYLSIREGRLGIIDRETRPVGFWISIGSVGVLTTVIAALIAWEAVLVLLSG